MAKGREQLLKRDFPRLAKDGCDSMWKRDRATLIGNRGFVSGTALALHGRWTDWQHSGSTNHKILAASLLLVGLTLVCKAAVAVREVVTAYWFGAGDELDALVVAVALPTFAIMALGRAAGSALLPTFSQVHQHDEPGAADQLLRETTFWFLALLAAATVVLATSSQHLVDMLCPGFAPEKRLLARQLMLILAPVVVLSGLTSLWSSVLHSRQQFAATGLAPILIPVCAVATMLLFGKAWGIRSLAIGILVGSLAEMITIGWLLHRVGHRLWPRVSRPSPRVVQVLRQYFPLVAAAAMMSSTVLVDNAMASQLGTGSVATLGYGRKLVALAISLPAMSLSRAVFPYFAQQVATCNWSAVRDTLAKSSIGVLLAMIPVTLVLLFFSHPLTSFALQRGAFRPENTEAVAWVQVMYALQIPFYTLSMLYVRLVSSMRLNYLLTISTLISVVLNVALNYLLMQRMGTAGIALSTSLVYATACLFLMLVTSRALARRERGRGGAAV